MHTRTTSASIAGRSTACAAAVIFSVAAVILSASAVALAQALPGAPSPFAVQTEFVLTQDEIGGGVILLAQIAAGDETIAAVQWVVDRSSWFGPAWNVQVVTPGSPTGLERTPVTAPAAGRPYLGYVSYDPVTGWLAYALVDEAAGQVVASGAANVGAALRAVEVRVPDHHGIVQESAAFVPFDVSWRFATRTAEGQHVAVTRVTRGDTVYVVASSRTGLELSGTFYLRSGGGDQAEPDEAVLYELALERGVSSPIPSGEIKGPAEVYTLALASPDGRLWFLGERELRIMDGSVSVSISEAKVVNGRVEGVLNLKVSGAPVEADMAFDLAISTWRFRGAEWAPYGNVEGAWRQTVGIDADQVRLPFSFPAPEVVTGELSLARIELKPSVSAGPGYVVQASNQNVYAYTELRGVAPISPLAGLDRKSAAHRTRRIIYNNDGLDNPGADINPVRFLERRTVGFEKTMVDTIAYSNGLFNLYTHTSDETELLNGPGTTRPEWQPWAWELQRQGFDTLKLVVDYAHANGLEVWWSFRMNDTHDNQASRQGWQLSQFKRNNPHLMMSPYRRQFPYGWAQGPSWTYTALNYEYAEVREKALRILEDVVTRYDVDGIELDYLRFPVFFREQMLGLPVTDAQRRLMTDWLASVRAMVDRVAEERGRPILIAVRVHDSVGYNFETGLDLGAWLERDLVDIVIATDYFRLQPWEHIVSFAAPYGVPVYASVSASRFPADNILPWRAEALRAWDAGVAGIHTFNIFNVNHPAFRELGDPELLRTLPRSDEFKPTADNLRNVASYRTFLKGGEKYLHPEVAATYPQYFGSGR